jgi:hypothetical protein
MRLRVALLVAAAVIFAPGWHGHGRPQNPRASDLAARVLAPTVDDGAIREAAADVRDQLGGRQTKRWRPGITLEAAATFGVGALAFALFWFVASYSGPLIGLYQLRFRFSRAPPRLQPA